MVNKLFVNYPLEDIPLLYFEGFISIDEATMNYRPIFSFYCLKWIYAWLILCLQVNCYADDLPQAVGEENVKDCAFIASIEGSSGLTKTDNWQQLAKNAALVQALKLKASHVVWEGVIQVSSENGIATGKAYRCNN